MKYFSLKWEKAKRKFIQNGKGKFILCLKKYEEKKKFRMQDKNDKVRQPAYRLIHNSRLHLNYCRKSTIYYITFELKS